MIRHIAAGGFLGHESDRSRKGLVLRGLVTPTFLAAFGVLALAPPLHAEDPSPVHTLFEIPVRGGLAAAAAAAGDRQPVDRSQFLVETIRRQHDTPPPSRATADASLQALLAHLDGATGASTSDTLPLPLHPDLWIQVVFGGRAEPETLLSSILRSRSARLLYYGLLSLDDSTRGWLAGQPDLLAEIAAKHAAAFVLAAPGLRINGNTVHGPGGAAAAEVWRALVGRSADDPKGFVRELLTRSFGRLALFFGALSHLTPAQLTFALKLDAPDPALRIDAGRRLALIFERLLPNWNVDERVFWAPTLDPILLLADLASTPDAPAIPGTRTFWTAVFEGASTPSRPASVDEGGALAGGEPVDFVWLSEQVFKGGQIAQRRPYDMVLFATRVIKRITADNARDALDAIRAMPRYPALVSALERAGVTDVAVYAAAVRRAAAISAIGDQARLRRALTQYQASLALLTRAAARGSLPADAFSTLLSSLTALELNERDEYDGRIIAWWEDVVRAHAGAAPAGNGAPPGEADVPWIGHAMSERFSDAVGPLDRGVIRLLAGPVASEPRIVDWEGTRYRVDLPWAEATRLGRLLGDHPRPYLSSALALVRVADTLAGSELESAAIREQTGLAERVQELVASRELQRIIPALQRASAESSPRSGQRLASIASSLRTVADDLFARGLTELVYAVALGQHEGARILADDAASRHDFGYRLHGSAGAWRSPVAGADRLRDWHVTGSLLGLDVRLADLALVRVSSRPPARPTLNDADRRVFIETVALMDTTVLRDEERDRIVAAIRVGRQRLAAARSAADVEAIADGIRISGPRRTLLAWAVARDSERAESLLSLTELFWLGLDDRIDRRLHAWGVSAEPRIGCLCLQLIGRQPLEQLAGRWDSGMFASSFPDLNLRLAELLADLEMPASLLPYVLAGAAAEMINTTAARGYDDRRGLVEYVRALAPERVEEFLAMLTTEGPLVAIGEVAAAAGTGSNPNTEVYP